MSVLDRVRAALAGTIAEIEEARRAATAELVGFMASERIMAARARELDAQVAEWQRRAEQAVLAGDDALASEALARRSSLISEAVRLRIDREEQGRLISDLLRGRRELDEKLRSLKLREGTVAAGLAAARTGGETPFATRGEVWDRMDEAERRIEEDAIVAELGMEEIDPAELAQQELRRHPGAGQAEDALAELKRKMQDRDRDKP